MGKYEKIDKHVAEGNARSILQDRATLQHGSHTGTPPAFYRYVVLDVISDPQQLIGEAGKTKTDYWRAMRVSNIDDYVGVLPRNTIIGQRILDGISNVEDPMFLFPFFPSHLALPCKPGEHVWVMFEAPAVIERSLGYWFCKITELGHVDDVNHTHAPRAFERSFSPGTKDISEGKTEPAYEFRNGQALKQSGESYTSVDSQVLPSEDEDVYEKLLTESDASKMMTYEAVPRYRKRPGDVVLEGTNNSVIVLGTDRTGPIADFSSPPDPIKGTVPAKPKNDLDGHCGMIDLIAGRGQTDETLGKEVTSKKIDKSDFNKELGKSESELSPKEGDPDWKTDRSRVLISQRTRVDKNLGLDTFNDVNFPNGAIIEQDAGSGAVIVKTDKVRIVARMDVEILVTGFKVDTKGSASELDDTKNYAAIVVRSNGDIIFRPSEKGVIKLGGDEADLAVLCQKSKTGATDRSGTVTADAIIDTMGGAQGGGDVMNGQFAKKVLLK